MYFGVDSWYMLPKSEFVPGAVELSPKMYKKAFVRIRNSATCPPLSSDWQLWNGLRWTLGVMTVAEAQLCPPRLFMRRFSLNMTANEAAFQSTANYQEGHPVYTNSAGEALYFKSGWWHISDSASKHGGTVTNWFSNQSSAVRMRAQDPKRDECPPLSMIWQRWSGWTWQADNASLTLAYS